MKKIFVELILFFFCAAFLLCRLSALNVRSIRTNFPRKADFYFSGGIVVRDVTLKRGFVKMPFDRSKNRKYFNIRILAKNLHTKMVRAFRGLSDKEKSVVPSFKVEETQKLLSRFRVANVNVSFDGELIVTFGLLKLERGKCAVSYPKHLEITNGILKKRVEKEVLKRCSLPGSPARARPRKKDRVYAEK